MERIVQEFRGLAGLSSAEISRSKMRRQAAEIVMAPARKIKSYAILFERLARALERRGFEIERAKYDAASRRHQRVIKTPGALWITARTGNHIYTIHTPRFTERGFTIMGSNVNRVYNSPKARAMFRRLLKYYLEKR